MSIASKARALAALLLVSIGAARGDGIQNGGVSAIGIITACGASNNQLLYDNSGSCAGLATANSSVLVTSAGGVPSISSTLPSGLTIPSPTMSGTIGGNLTFSGNLTFNGTASVGNGSLSVGGNAMTFPGGPDTLAGIGTAQTFTAVQTFTNSDLKLLGSSTGATTFTSANAGASNFTLTFPAVTDTIAVLGTAQSFTAAQTFAAGTITTSTKSLNITQTWNASGTVFDAPLFVGVTNTASALGSLLMDLQVGGTTKLGVTTVTNGSYVGPVLSGTAGLWGFGAIGSDQSYAIRSGVTNGTNGSDNTLIWGNGQATAGFIQNDRSIRLRAAGYFGWTSNATDPTQAADTFLTRNAAAALQLGAADAASPVAQTLQAQSVVAANANAAGATFTIAGSKSNGSGGGDLVFQTTNNNAASGTQNTLATALTIKGGTQNLIGASTADASASSGSGSLQIVGGASVAKRFWLPAITASAGLQTAVLCQSSGGEVIADSVACLASSEQFKTVLGPMEDGALDKLVRLPLYRWHYNAEGIFQSDSWTRERIGPVAEDVAGIDERLAGYGSDGKVRTFSPDQLLALAIKAIQEMQAEIDGLRHGRH